MSVTNPVKENQIVKDKKINFSTLKRMLEMLDEEKHYGEFIKQLLTECEQQIKARQIRKTYRQKSKYPIINLFQQHYSRKYSKKTLKNHTYYAIQFVWFLDASFPEITSLANIKNCNKNIKTHMITAYEDYLSQQVFNKQLKKSTVIRYLGSMKLFLKMLCSYSK